MIVGHDVLWGIPITFEDITENEDIDYFYGEEDPFSSEEE